MENELVRRYTYAVTQQLPESQRADIEKELNGLIEDMLEDRLQGRAATEQDVEAVLLELGSPADLADKYRGRKRYLIGPELFPTYMTVLKIVLFALGIAMLVVFAIQTLLTPPQALDHFISGLSDLWMGVLQGFAWVTIIFALIENAGLRKGKLKAQEAHEWRPSDLPPLPDEARRIKPAHPIVSIIFTIFFVVLVTSSINLFGVWFSANRYPTAVIPVLNAVVFQGYLPFIWILAAFSILNNAIQLISGRWTAPIVAMDVLSNVLNFGLAVVMFSNPAIWNPTFMQQLAQSGFAPVGSAGYQNASTVWQQITQGFVYFIVVIFALHMLSTAAKLFRMRNIPWKDHAAHSSI